MKSKKKPIQTLNIVDKGTVPFKEFDYSAEVELVNPIANTVANATLQGEDVDWFIKADDIVLKRNPTGSRSNGEACFVGFTEKGQQREYFAIYLNDSSQKEQI